MDYLLAFLWALPSGILWFFNAEVFVYLRVSQTDAVPWLIALVVTCGQFIGYFVLFMLADRFIAKLGFVRRALEKVQLRRVGRASYVVFATGGLCGIPPLLGLFTLYGSARVIPFWKLACAAMPMRLVWYLVWAYSPDFMCDHLGLCITP
ncbi:MAG: hypothetical protein KC635_02595 [Myxococcales bacterium]|nr:hypothetical protein [Myxococcales bacterium]MCB9731050.1 hypothetical protein [Deltaproteobacteria bacterium]